MTAASALSISANNMEKFRPIKLDSLQTVLAMNATVRRDFKTMLDYSCIFIETLCGVTRNNPVYSLHYILQCGKSFIVHFIPPVEKFVYPTGDGVFGTKITVFRRNVYPYP